MAKRRKSNKRGTSQKKTKLAPALSAFGIKLKRKPRGRSFEPGNGFGAEYRFPKGVSGNPGGKPKTQKVNESARKRLAADADNPPKVETGADEIVEMLYQKAKRGDVGAARELADRAEGRPAQTLDVHDDRVDPFLELAASMNRHGALLGPPPAEDSDDFPPRLEEAKDANDA
jgi:uncharacterized protein DUF5681